MSDAARCAVCGKPETDNPGLDSALRPLPTCCLSVRHHVVFHRSCPARDATSRDNALLRMIRRAGGLFSKGRS